ncbi:hypothetical protein E1182_04730 [Micromonospora sp. KC721]|nr:hypothetical protein E1182_04730 [Micromonospora sp. KC721]
MPHLPADEPRVALHQSVDRLLGVGHRGFAGRGARGGAGGCRRGGGAVGGGGAGGERRAGGAGHE